MKSVIVLGSGRSGTSMVAGALSRSGYFMGERPHYLKKNKANRKGFFEDYEVNTINEDILNQVMINWPEKIRKTFFPSHTFYRARWLARISKPVLISDNDINARISKVIAKKPFCFKDPRFSYTLPVWKKHLDTDVRILVVFRHPLLTADSINRECKESPALRKLKMNSKIALEVWYKMYQSILSIHEKSEKMNWCFVHYDQMFSPEKIVNIEKFLQAEIDREFMDSCISRSKAEDSKLPSSIKKVYNKLNVLAQY